MINVWNTKPIKDHATSDITRVVNVRAHSDVSLDRVAKMADEAHLSLAKLDRLVEEARKRAMGGDRAALAVLAALVEVPYSLLAECRVDLEAGK